MPKHAIERLRLHGLRVERQEVIAEEAFLLVTKEMASRTISRHCARHHERHGRRVAC